MGVTRFPNGVEIGDSTTAATFSIGGTAVTSTAAALNQGASLSGAALAYTAAGAKVFAGTIIVTGSTAFKPAGIASAAFIVASPYGTYPAASGTAGGFQGVTGAVGAAGTVTLYGWDASGTAATQAGTVSYLVVGT